VPTYSDPFAPANLTIEFVDSAAGSRKTLTAVAKALTAARRRGTRTIFAMPTLDLVAEMHKVAKQDGMVPIYEITSRNRPVIGSIESLILKHLDSPKAQAGHLLFITHEGFLRVSSWPASAKGFEIYIDEVLETVLNRTPFKLRDSHWVLTSFVDTVPVLSTLAEREKRKQLEPAKFTYIGKKTDAGRLEACRRMMLPEANASDAEIEMASRQIELLEAKQEKWEAWLNHDTTVDTAAAAYYQIVAKPSNTASDPWYWLRRRDYAKPIDDIYEYLDPIARWLLQDNALFTDRAAWDLTTTKSNDKNRKRGLITITGFRRPDALAAFGRVTVMSALFTHTMLYSVWSKLGVDFRRSQTVNIAQRTTDLGKRRLRIYWLSEEGWSKYIRNKSGGIENILRLIRDSGVINLKQPVCVTVNKDDGSVKNPGMVRDIFKKAIVMPHNVRGQNLWLKRHQMIYCAALKLLYVRYTLVGICAWY
jgi:hypothetical protein